MWWRTAKNYSPPRRLSLARVSCSAKSSRRSPSATPDWADWPTPGQCSAGRRSLWDTAWGAALLHRGDQDGAIAKLKEAHRKGPHFADPLELWGEALMAKRDYAGAIARFAEADPFAPRWGRNHVLWGEALMLSGRYREARAQYEAAKGMDLSQADRAALEALLVRTASGPLHG
jgi:tetratricopeptide (TPR) repeat protein